MGDRRARARIRPRTCGRIWLRTRGAMWLRTRGATPWIAVLSAAVLAADVAMIAVTRSADGPDAPETVRRDGLQARQASTPPLLPRRVPTATRLPYAQHDRLGAYRGVGAWVDLFDYAPAFQGRGEPPSVSPDSIPMMAAAGVQTLYIQAARDDPRSPGDLAHPQLFSAFVQRAHAHRMRVVAWYLPTFVDPERDLRRLLAIHGFRAGEQGVDGLAVDIEWVQGVRNVADRNRRLVDLSHRLRGAVGSDALGAIVLPPVDTDVVNPRFWPGFPWRELRAVYDVWLPMSYWTNRSGGWREAGRYTSENIRRLEAHVGPGARVHPVGGIGDRATSADYHAFVLAARERQAIGVSIYDWDTAQSQAWELLRASGRDAA